MTDNRRPLISDSTLAEIAAMKERDRLAGGPPWEVPDHPDHGLPGGWHRNLGTAWPDEPARHYGNAFTRPSYTAYGKFKDEAVITFSPERVTCPVYAEEVRQLSEVAR